MVGSFAPELNQVTEAQPTISFGSYFGKVLVGLQRTNCKTTGPRGLICGIVEFLGFCDSPHDHLSPDMAHPENGYWKVLLTQEQNLDVDMKKCRIKFYTEEKI